MSLNLKIGFVPLTLGLAALGLAAVPASASVTVYNFQVLDNGSTGFGSGDTGVYSGAGALTGSAGTGTGFFNAQTADAGNNKQFTFTNAKDSTGASSNVGLTVTGGGTFSSPGGFSVANGNTPGVLLAPYLFTGGGTNGFTLTGLASNSTYRLYLYGIDGGFHDRGTTFFVTGGTADGGISSTKNSTTSSFVEGNNYVLFTGDTATGSVSGSFAPGPSGRGEGDFNGLQIAVTTTGASPAPEPSQVGMLSLMGLSLGGLILRARPRRAVSLPA